ncbi:UNVERIFIED_CONTAM: Retrovirus-related Pol polyprotein from transposon RE2 [Sesamum calycinum]|uniref:Retrovirus-related Pol polyprotein from transposon RE2 n=1 Tax=Sesamum calycinum TaxID=2727403 RepID=A0AAW2SDI2_9LAMI
MATEGEHHANTNAGNSGRRREPELPEFLQLHGGDHPGMILVSGNSSSAKMKLGFIDGRYIMPDKTSETYDTWVRVDSMVTSWILNAVTKKISRGFLYTKSSRQLWLDLEERYGENNGPLVYQLQRAIASITQGTLSIVEYFNNLTALWDELECLKPPKVCTCGLCTCGVTKVTTEEDNLTKCGLHTRWNDHKGGNAPRGNIQNIAKGDYRGKGVIDKKSQTCSHCGRIGHTKESCFKLHGVPDWYKQLKDQKVKETGSARGFNVITADAGNDSENASNLGEAVKQMTELIKLMKENIPQQDPLQVNFAHGDDFAGTSALVTPSENGFGLWIVDTVESVGVLQLSDTLSLTNVLCIPAFKYNLLSVQKLCSSAAVLVLFSPSHCWIHDLKTRDILAVRRVSNPPTYLPAPIPDTEPCPVVATPQNLTTPTLCPTSTIQASSLPHSAPTILLLLDVLRDKLTSHIGYKILSVEAVHEPRSFKEANQSSHWREAMNKEIEALTELPAGKELLAPGGFTSFSPVAKTVTVRLFIAIATARHWPILQLDVNNAFLHGHLDEEVYMVPPEGYAKARDGLVCCLKRSLYGLKQASRQWNIELTSKLEAFGFKQSSHDHCLFTMRTDSSFLALIVYVDDVLLTGDSLDSLSSVKHYLDDLFTIKDLGHAKFFLGLELARSTHGTFITQKKYLMDIVRDCHLEEAKPAATPLPVGIKFDASTGPALPSPDRYRSQFLQHPREPHWDAALHLVRYLKGSSTLGLFFGTDSPLTLSAFSDSDWASCLDTRRSVTGYCVFLGGSLVSWKTKKQATVSRSSAEAEYRSMASTVCELLWISYILGDFGITVVSPIPFHCDNKAAIHITENPVFHERTKHLDIDCHIVRDRFKSGFILPQHVSTQHQVADLFTKLSLPSVHPSHVQVGHAFSCTNLRGVSQVSRF